MKTLTLNEIQQVSGGFFSELFCLASTASGALLGATLVSAQKFGDVTLSGLGVTVPEVAIMIAGAVALGTICYSLTNPNQSQDCYIY